ncbi:MAG: AmmeMemoRadiSam system protein A [bacterium]|nr:AmmeMemoRadiSam system protein A [bacterium]
MLRPALEFNETEDDRVGVPWPREPWLKEHGAAFVTLMRGGSLRGCVGSLSAVRPLIDDVRENAVAAATRDSRFPPLVAEELDEVEIEVTLLSATEPMSYTDESDALAQLRPGVDGVVLRWGARRATFLPQVWDNLPEPEQFLAQLKRKAGLPTDFWDGDVRLERYRAEKWSERSK